MIAGCHKQEQQQRRQRELQQPDDRRPSSFGLGEPLAEARADQPRQARARRQQEQDQNPLRPGAQQHKIALRKNRARILK